MPVRFQVDPDFYDHPKSINLSDAATALWVRAGSYSAAKLTDGFIAEHVLPTLSKSPDEAADELKRRGLWHRVKGGYRFHQWSDRNLTRGRVESERASDRARKASVRAAARRTATQNRNAQGQNENTQVEPDIVRPESARNPNGIQPESDRNPAVSVSVSVSESELGSGRPRDSPAINPPPPRCTAHTNDPNPPSCGLCADARRTRQAWEQDQAATAARQQQQRARDQAEASRLAINACNLCDHRGYHAGGWCHHDPDSGDRAKRGAAAVRAALDRGAA